MVPLEGLKRWDKKKKKKKLMDLTFETYNVQKGQKWEGEEEEEEEEEEKCKSVVSFWLLLEKKVYCVQGISGCSILLRC